MKVGAGGFGCEPASGAAIAGAKRLCAEGVIAADDRVVCIVTGHGLKDPNATVAYHAGEKGGAGAGRFANQPIVVENDIEKIVAALHKVL